MLIGVKFRSLQMSFVDGHYLVKCKTTDAHSSMWIFPDGKRLTWHKKIPDCLIVNLWIKWLQSDLINY